MGGPVSDCTWLKASVPSNLNLCNASLQTPAALLTSTISSQSQVDIREECELETNVFFKIVIKCIVSGFILLASHFRIY